ncbi:MAG TPA: asparagine synthase (glutamine-hydrolyzing) [Methylomirabilota bacterium]|jgi:asparagine synthase (glutamine-hydrolysing)
MCGIAGAYHFATGAPVPEDLARRMADHLVHRGPDDRGEYRDPTGCLALGFTRLSIIDLAGGHQPMANADGSLWLVYNGEIYNHLELRARLAHRTFRTRSDTEVILHLYEEEGLEAFRHLRGMFAIALWDRARRRLVLARDRLGIKPLYYAVAPHRLLFASEVPALLRPTSVPREVDPDALRQYLETRAVPAPLTLLRHVRKLVPGHYLVCDERGVGAQTPFWKLTARPRPDGPTSEADAVRELREAIDRTVSAHMLSDVPVGAMLSGGLDSSVIVSAMRRSTAGELHTFSVGFEEEGFHEFEYSRQVSRLFGTRAHEYVLRPEDFVEFLPQLVVEFADPVADPAAVPLHFISRVARAHGIKVVLSGEGSDELFAGYPSYRLEADGGDSWASLRRIARRTRARWRAARAGEGRSSTGRPRDRFYPGHAGLPDPSLVDSLVLQPADPELDMLDAYHREAAEAGLDRLQTMLAIDLQTRIPEDLLCRTDRMTMANSIEARVPFLDHELVELGFWLPSALKIRRGVSKYVLKRAAEAWLPSNVIYRPKMGFPTPIRRWLTGELSSLFQRGLVEMREEPALLDRRVLERLVARHFAGDGSLSLLLWRVWFFRMWYAVWVEGRALEVTSGRRAVEVVG